MRTVTTPHGDARVQESGPRSAAVTVVLGHGAGGGVDAADLQAVARVLRGHRVLLVEQPWRVAGRRVAPRGPVLDEAWSAIVPRLAVRGALILGGRSAGARVACRTAAALGASGVLALAFPLHPPGRPERSRGAELTAVGCPVLVVQGERDPFGTPAEVAAAAPGVEVVPVASAAHALRPDLGGALDRIRVWVDARAA